MKKFFGSCLGGFVAVILFFVISTAILFMLFGKEEEEQLDDNTVLHISLAQPLREQQEENAIAQFAEDEPLSIGLHNMLKAIASAKKDSHIKGIHLYIKNVTTSNAIASELRDALMDFKEEGKWIVASGTDMSWKGYYIASVADEIYLHPEGAVEFYGLSSQLLFFKKMFEKLDIRPEVFRVGEYKSAVEPFIREDMSDENRMQRNVLLKALYNETTSKVAKSRNLPVERVRALADSALVRSAHDAMAYGLVDSLFYSDQVNANLRRRLGLEEDDKINAITQRKYYKSLPKAEEDSENTIAVVVAEGEIRKGKSDAENNVVGDKSIVKAIRKAAKDDDVKAIVLRINSPGGNFLASDNMWRSIRNAADKKPIIASMSGYAASGGYYIAMACDAIVARPTTITGSIGVFGLMFDASRFMDKKLGITSDEINTGQMGPLTPLRPMSPLARSIVQQSVDSVYEVFIKKAAAGRNMKAEQVRKVASGRVWTGADAKQKGLVDQLGTYKDALELAADKAEIEDYNVSFYNKPEDPFEKIVKKIMNNAELYLTCQRLGVNYELYQQWTRIKEYEGVQARMPLIGIEGMPSPKLNGSSMP